MTEIPKNNGESKETLPEKYDLRVSDPKVTGPRLYSLHSQETDITGVFVEFNDNYDIHAAIPWAGARTSRSDDPHEEIYSEIKDVTHSEKIDMFFGYGHASIANMSPTMIHLNNLPMHEAYWIFNHLTLVGGQETSTRYVELSNPTVTPLEDLVDLESLEEEKRQEMTARWQDIQNKAHDGFGKWYPAIRERLLEFVRSEHPDAKDKAMDKRALDAARAWLPFGGRTSMSLQFDVREAINLTTQLNQRDDFYGRELADHITTLYSLKKYQEADDIQADLAGLMKYTEGSDTVMRNSYRLREALDRIPGFSYLQELSASRLQDAPSAEESQIGFTSMDEIQDPGNEIVAGYIMTMLPNVRFREALQFVNSLADKQKTELLSTIFDRHTQHDQLRNAADFRGDAFEIDTALAYQRDFNRHRSMGRLAVMLETDNYDAVIRSGYNRSHVLSRTNVLKDMEDEWNQDMADLYKDIYAFYEDIKTVLGEEADYGFMYHILPLGHQSKLVMSGPLMQWNYLTHLRIRPGGDYGYREVTYDIANTLRRKTGIYSEKTATTPDYNNTQELLDRS